MYALYKSATDEVEGQISEDVDNDGGLLDEHEAIETDETIPASTEGLPNVNNNHNGADNHNDEGQVFHATEESSRHDRDASHQAEPSANNNNNTLIEQSPLEQTSNLYNENKTVEDRDTEKACKPSMSKGDEVVKKKTKEVAARKTKAKSPVKKRLAAQDASQLPPRSRNDDDFMNAEQPNNYIPERGDNNTNPLNSVQDTQTTEDLTNSMAEETANMTFDATATGFLVPERPSKIPTVISDENVLVESNVSQTSNRIYAITCAMFVALVVLVVGLSVGLTVGRSHQQEVETSAPQVPTAFPTQSPMPSASPTEAPTSRIFALVSEDIVDNFGLQARTQLEDSTSPQAQAARWIGEVDTTFRFPLSAMSNSASLDALEAIKKAFRQRYALAVFFFSTGGEASWVDHLNFLTDKHECQWNRFFVLYRGVACKDDLWVTTLNIPENNLTGAIPPEISGLEELQILVLNENSIGGSIPDGFYQLSNLVLFQMPSNPFTGTLSSLIGQLINLQSFWLQRTEMTGSLPLEIGYLHALQAITLSNSRFKGSLPNEWGSLTLLQSLNLAYNFLTGTIPAWVSNIVTFSGTENRFIGTIPMGNYAAMSAFSIERNVISGTIPADILGPNLELLSLDNNTLTGTLPESWQTATSLKMLDVGKNKISGSLPSSLGALTNLVMFVAFLNQLTGTIPTELGNTKLAFLALEENQLTGSVPDSLSRLPLEQLTLGNNQLTGDLTDFCNNIHGLVLFSADCPDEVICPCCTLCYGRGGPNLGN